MHKDSFLMYKYTSSAVKRKLAGDSGELLYLCWIGDPGVLTCVRASRESAGAE